MKQFVAHVNTNYDNWRLRGELILKIHAKHLQNEFVGVQGARFCFSVLSSVAGSK